ncbi:winged helix DNA-binding domain-containing protein [Herbiconiux sp. CPCC 205763]|uniref:Winged helix DNA-binding domain-containing protein n=1 Tax=Herbiconiux aconitum TaxID=2970913 RepID=A0ABT2GP84_9MICO|nr:winged helix DNA-binding domain-containing protein [Herbiconiux aconitum]MCS5717983.1 winged helix DNA-binding domain-containing protein [Herbiconiux aconitum]
MVKSATRSRTAARELLLRRLETQWIAPPARPAGTAGRGIADVARHLLALQAQDFGQAVWALGLRSPGATRADVAAALDGAQVVRSWPMRGTLHFSTPDDLRWMLSLTAAKTITGVAARHRQLELDDTVFGRARRIAAAELRGGGSFSRDEFFALLEADGIPTKNQRGVHIIWWLAHDGLLCWGPTRGTQQALVLLDEWAPPARDPHASRDDSLAEFVLRYFTGHGPATLKDFCWWSKTTVTDAQRGLALVRDRLTETEIDGVTFWMRDPADRDASAGRHDGSSRPAAGAHPSPRRRPPGVRALPGFDEYLLGYQDRSHALPSEFADRIVPGNNGMFLPMIVSRGEIVGTWRRSVTAKKAEVTAEPFTALSSTEQRGFVREVTRYGRFLGVPVTITDSAPADHGTVGNQGQGQGHGAGDPDGDRA